MTDLPIMKTKKSFLPDVPDSEVDESGMTTFCSWNRLEEEGGVRVFPGDTAQILSLSDTVIARVAALKPYEELVGFIANEYGLSIRLRYRKQLETR